METKDSSIIIVNSGQGSDQGSANNQSSANLSFTAGASWIVNVKTDLIIKNTLIRPDGFSSIIFENVGEDPCNIMDSCPINPETFTRVVLNSTGISCDTERSPIRAIIRSSKLDGFTSKINESAS